jgi:hypothetical protein
MFVELLHAAESASGSRLPLIAHRVHRRREIFLLLVGSFPGRIVLFPSNIYAIFLYVHTKKSMKRPEDEADAAAVAPADVLFGVVK